MSTCCKSSGSLLEAVSACAAHSSSCGQDVQKAAPWMSRNTPPPELRQVFVQPATVSSVVQMRATVFCTFAARCPSTLTSSIAAWACAGCRSPSGSEYSGVCCWDCAEGRRGPSLDEGNKSFVLLNPPQCEKLWKTCERMELTCRYAHSRPFQKHPVCQAPLRRWRSCRGVRVLPH